MNFMVYCVLANQNIQDAIIITDSQPTLAIDYDITKV